MFFQIGMKGDEESGKDRELLILIFVVVLFLLIFCIFFCQFLVFNMLLFQIAFRNM